MAYSTIDRMFQGRMEDIGSMALAIFIFHGLHFLIMYAMLYDIYFQVT